MQPRVSVAVLTYNHRKYIEEALNSIIQQQTSFPFEVVIGDDHSSDWTAEIVRRICQSDPVKLRCISRGRNIGAFENMLDVQRRCRGKYVAWLEGDDFWTDPKKLEKQVAFLDRHQGCVLCFGVAKELRDTGEYSCDFRPAVTKFRYTLDDILNEMFVPSCTLMHRNGLIVEYPDWFLQLHQTDWSQCVLLAQHGWLGFIDEPLAVRRVHGQGLWGGIAHKDRLEIQIASYRAFLDHFPMHSERIKRRIGATRFRLATDYLYHSKFRNALRLAHEDFSEWARNSDVRKADLARFVLKLILPGSIREMLRPM
jgi:glycosyltransferase involved in cell wall biosynthesis